MPAVAAVVPFVVRNEGNPVGIMGVERPPALVLVLVEAV
jgi:hypothetical protein